MRFEYQLVSDWPRLAWLAMWRQTSETAIVQHGQRVETESGNHKLKEHVLLNAQFGRDFSKYLLLTKPSGLIRNGFLFSRSLAGLVDRKISASTTWYAPTAPYLHQLDSLSKTH
jgi:hypothetical protein